MQLGAFLSTKGKKRGEKRRNKVLQIHLREKEIHPLGFPSNVDVTRIR